VSKSNIGGGHWEILNSANQKANVNNNAAVQHKNQLNKTPSPQFFISIAKRNIFVDLKLNL